MAQDNKTVTSSTKEEALMYILLMVGVGAVVSLFAVNIVLIDKVMESTMIENHYLRQMIELRQDTGTREEVVDTTSPGLEIESEGVEKTEEADEVVEVVEVEDEDFEDFSDLEDGSNDPDEDTDLSE